MKYLIVLSAILLSGCGTYGEPLLLARMYDQADPCQSRKELGRPAGYQTPEWCGAGKKSYRILDNQGRQIGSIK